MNMTQANSILLAHNPVRSIPPIVRNTVSTTLPTGILPPAAGRSVARPADGPVISHTSIDSKKAPARIPTVPISEDIDDHKLTRRPTKMQAAKELKDAAKRDILLLASSKPTKNDIRTFFRFRIEELDKLT